MNEMKRDMIRIQELVGSAFGQTGALVALSDGGHMNPKKLQKTLEQTMEHFESAALELRRLCEQYSPGTGGFSKKSVLPAMDVTGSVEEFGYGWLHITLNTLLPHCRYPSSWAAHREAAGACRRAAVTAHRPIWSRSLPQTQRASCLKCLRRIFGKKAFTSRQSTS